MEAIAYSAFRQNLKACLRKVATDAAPLLVTNQDPADNAVVMNARDYDALMETVRIYSNPQLYAKVRRGMEQARAAELAIHELTADD